MEKEIWRVTHYISLLVLLCFVAGLAVGYLLFSVAYWIGIKEGRRRGRREGLKMAMEHLELASQVQPATPGEGVGQKGP